MNGSDLHYEYLAGQGQGGQHMQKNATTVRVTHIPTGISAIARGRSRNQNRKKALRELKRKLDDRDAAGIAARKQSRRNRLIKESRIIKTYDYKRGAMKDHRTGKTYPLKEVLNGRAGIEGPIRTNVVDSGTCSVV